MQVRVICDAKGCYYEENYTVSDDEAISDLKKRMKANGWTIIEEDHYCPICTNES